MDIQEKPKMGIENEKREVISAYLRQKREEILEQIGQSLGVDLTNYPARVIQSSLCGFMSYHLASLAVKDKVLAKDQLLQIQTNDQVCDKAEGHIMLGIKTENGILVFDTTPGQTFSFKNQATPQIHSFSNEQEALERLSTTYKTKFGKTSIWNLSPCPIIRTDKIEENFRYLQKQITKNLNPESS